MKNPAESLRRGLARASSGAGAAFERGTVAVVACIACIALTAIAGLGLDGAGYALARSEQAAASEACIQAVEGETATAVKFSATPGREVAEVCRAVLSANGYDGEAALHYWEDKTASTQTDRRYCYAIELDGGYRSMFGSVVGRDEPAVKTTTFGSERLYNSEKVWRPNWTNEADAAAYSVDCGTFSWDASKGEGAPISFDGAPSADSFPAHVRDGFASMRGQ